MKDEERPYARTRAAIMLGDALRRHTSRHAGGLRALASELGIKQATVLSQMANGRIGIPLDRAVDLAVKVEMNVADFCAAVIEQRAPAVYDALNRKQQLHEADQLPHGLADALKRAASMNGLTDEHVAVIDEVIATKRPAAKWMRPFEDDIISAIRDQFPEGLSYAQSQELIEWIRVVPDL